MWVLGFEAGFFGRAARALFPRRSIAEERIQGALVMSTAVGDGRPKFLKHGFMKCEAMTRSEKGANPSGVTPVPGRKMLVPWAVREAALVAGEGRVVENSPPHHLVGVLQLFICSVLFSGCHLLRTKSNFPSLAAS